MDAVADPPEGKAGETLWEFRAVGQNPDLLHIPRPSNLPETYYTSTHQTLRTHPSTHLGIE